MSILKEILNVLLVVFPIGAVLGILLAFFSHKFSVQENEDAKKIRSCLPGANCGACGFNGCDDYAANVADGNAAPNLCVPGGADVAKDIGEILGIEVEAPAEVVAFVHCNGNCEATTQKAIYDGISGCRAASMLYGGPDACVFGCLGLGDCVSKCPENAICIKDGIAHVDPRLCIGCGMCAKTCPKQVISMVPKKTKVVVMCNNKEKGADARKACQNACIACKKCEKACPFGAIKVKDNLARIDYKKCKGCGLCAKDCPSGCLKKIASPVINK